MRKSGQRKPLTWANAATWLAVALAASASHAAAKPPGGPGKTVQVPDIVYMSDDNSTDALSQAAVRGVALATDGILGSDLSLQRSKAGRLYQAVTWSPDGQLLAWLDIGLGMVSTPKSIMVSRPTGKAAAVYTSIPGDGKPAISTAVDSLAWGPDCADPTDSVLMFASNAPAGLFAIHFVDGQANTPMQLFAVDSGRPSALALSPSGRHVAFAGSSSPDGYGIWLFDLCTAGAVPQQLLDKDGIGGTGPVISMDWSRQGDRLAISVVTGPDPAYFDWRDLKIIDLGYVGGSDEQVTGVVRVWKVDLDSKFTAESSEHSPQWGPSNSGSTCQRIAFSQSSDSAGRNLYLLDINDGRIGDCEINSPLKLPARYPRALDWK